jgi:3-hydroxyisobutyrate dehydrogenase-like beta-hydroxyacid dehydrogenase
MPPTSQPAVGFVGLGDQGLPMATAIAEAGFHLHAWARHPGSLDALVGVPHVCHDSLAALAADSDVVCLCVSTDQDVMDLLGSELVAALRPGSVVVNHGTGTPANAVTMADTCATARLEFLDAPVSGGHDGAVARKLTTMVGGPPAAVDRCDPIFRTFSTHVAHLGAHGAGQLAKLINNALMMMNHGSVAN